MQEIGPSSPGGYYLRGVPGSGIWGNAPFETNWPFGTLGMISNYYATTSWVFEAVDGSEPAMTYNNRGTARGFATSNLRVENDVQVPGLSFNKTYRVKAQFIGLNGSPDGTFSDSFYIRPTAPATAPIQQSAQIIQPAELALSTQTNPLPVQLRLIDPSLNQYVLEATGIKTNWPYLNLSDVNTYYGATRWVFLAEPSNSAITLTKDIQGIVKTDNGNYLEYAITVLDPGIKVNQTYRVEVTFVAKDGTLTGNSAIAWIRTIPQV